LPRRNGIRAPFRLLTIIAFALVGVAVRAGGARAADLWVDIGSSNCSDAISASQPTPERPWCTVGRAASLATAGDTVYIMPGDYPGSVRPTASGSPGLPIRFVGVGVGVSIDAVGASSAIKLVGVSDVSFQGVRVTGATGEGIWVERCARLGLLGVDVEGNPGAGIEIKDSSAVSVEFCSPGGDPRRVKIPRYTGTRSNFQTGIFPPELADPREWKRGDPRARGDNFRSLRRERDLRERDRRLGI
jgi:hypothetical protein